MAVDVAAVDFYGNQRIWTYYWRTHDQCCLTNAYYYVMDEYVGFVVAVAVVAIDAVRIDRSNG